MCIYIYIYREREGYLCIIIYIYTINVFICIYNWIGKLILCSCFNSPLRLKIGGCHPPSAQVLQGGCNSLAICLWGDGKPLKISHVHQSTNDHWLRDGGDIYTYIHFNRCGHVLFMLLFPCEVKDRLLPFPFHSIYGRWWQSPCHLPLLQGMVAAVENEARTSIYYWQLTMGWWWWSSLSSYIHIYICKYTCS